ncbi:hypothetical protein [Streptomyces misionensis]|nr:hypothetical protein [Streptomyces misionensis]
MLPLLVIVCLSAPAWVLWPFLSAPRQQVVLEMVKALGTWVGVANEPTGKEEKPELPPPDKEKPRRPLARKAKGAGAKSSVAVTPSRQRLPGGGAQQAQRRRRA